MRKILIMFGIFCLTLSAQARVSEEAIAKLVASAQSKSKIQSGIVVVAVDGKIRFAQSYGYADRQKKSAITVDSLFPLGSLSKQFTASLILTLAQEKKLDLQVPINQYLENLPPAWQALTLHQLLTHTSGIPDCVEKLAIKTTDNDACFHAVRDLPLMFAPGSEFAYSNTNYVVLAKMIAKLTGISYSAYLQQALLQPLDLKNTISPNEQGHYSFSTTQTANLVKHYRIDFTEYPPSLGFAGQLAGAGELFGNAKDLVVWTDALFNGSILSKESIAKMQTKHAYDADKRRWYGYGLCIRESALGDVYFHLGKIAQNGVVMSTYLPCERLNVIVFTNVFETEFNSLPYMDYALGLTVSLGKYLKENE